MDLPQYYYDETSIIEGNSQFNPVMGLHGSDAAYKEFRERDRRSIPWICVAGYDTSLPTEEIKTLLTNNHFSSCGRITDVYIANDNKRCAYIYIGGKDSAVKAMELNGSEVGGRKIVACVSHLPLNKTLTNEGPYGSTVPGPQRSLYTLGSTVPGQREQKALRALGTNVPGPYGYTVPVQRTLYTLGSGTTFGSGSGTTDPADRINKADKMTEE